VCKTVGFPRRGLREGPDLGLGLMHRGPYMKSRRSSRRAQPQKVRPARSRRPSWLFRPTVRCRRAVFLGSSFVQRVGLPGCPARLMTAAWSSSRSPTARATPSPSLYGWRARPRSRSKAGLPDNRRAGRGGARVGGAAGQRPPGLRSPERARSSRNRKRALERRRSRAGVLSA
jgi:hypothetical protein